MGSAEGATGCQPPPSGPSDFPASQGAAVEAFLPAWASWMPSFACPWARQSFTTRSRADSFASEYRPEQPGVMRPIASTSVISKHRSAARSEEHTSELQSLTNLVCRLLLEKKK